MSLSPLTPWPVPCSLPAPVACPAGVFGGTAAATNIAGCGSTLCPPGYYCPSGSSGARLLCCEEGRNLNCRDGCGGCVSSCCCSCNCMFSWEVLWQHRPRCGLHLCLHAGSLLSPGHGHPTGLPGWLLRQRHRSQHCCMLWPGPRGLLCLRRKHSACHLPLRLVLCGWSWRPCVLSRWRFRQLNRLEDVCMLRTVRSFSTGE